MGSGKTLIFFGLCGLHNIIKQKIPPQCHYVTFVSVMMNIVLKYQSYEKRFPNCLDYGQIVVTTNFIHGSELEYVVT